MRSYVFRDKLSSIRHIFLTLANTFDGWVDTGANWFPRRHCLAIVTNVAFLQCATHLQLSVLTTQSTFVWRIIIDGWPRKQTFLPWMLHCRYYVVWKSPFLNFLCHENYLLIQGIFLLKVSPKYSLKSTILWPIGVSILKTLRQCSHKSWQCDKLCVKCLLHTSS